ncbi:MAG: RagB/SusD family nutrient uptake outer membrane protein [Bacteroidetes bacterium]|nr:RagB/SusD family nutrient uptake outer membrane protein [Bacteroidota bacterium]MBS1929971.1 RagB/SusD family nutrient uptake outer membrane protein [Bacteroidota bacterium]
MKKIFSICGMSISAIVLLLTSCKKDFLETKPLSEISQLDVWNDPTLTETFVNGIYNGLEKPLIKYSRSIFVDESQRRSNKNLQDFNNCLLTPDQIPGWVGGNTDPNMYWKPLYSNIRSCNLFFQNISKVPDDNTLIDGKTLKQRLTGEVHFLRAWLYFNLTNLYGGVPIISKVYQLTDSFEVARNTYADCIKFIVADCDSAAALLPKVESGNNKGRATLGAALALKSRVLLYAASDLHNTTTFPGYSNPELLGYTDGNRTARWQAAKDAAKAVIDLGLYNLYKANPAPGDDITQNFVNMWLTTNNEEDIFVKYYTPTTTVYEQTMWLLNGPNGYHSQGNNTPIGNMVDAYEMADGSKFDWNDSVKAKEPYKNRDPRFYSDILYEGAKWAKRPSDVANIDPIGIIQVGKWIKWNSTTNSAQTVFGLDTPNGPIETNNSSATGYYCRKFLDPNLTGPYETNIQPYTYRYIRYAEILMNYAEACIGIGQENEARTYINMVRKRAGMPDITESGDALVARYRNERRVEFYNEDKRFFDVRRWKIGPQAYTNATKVTVVYPLNPDHTTATIPTITSQLLEKRSWNDKAYFFPILRDEMNKNSKLIQNPGYN